MAPDLRNLTFDELSALFTEMSAEPYRAGQAFDWLHKRGAENIDDMRDLPKALRADLAAKAGLSRAKIVTRLDSGDGSAKKYLFELENRTIIEGKAVSVESVWMRHGYGASACVSVQAGCRMGCAFCASAVGGLARNLGAGEMLAQVHAMARDAGERASRVVLMGSGEPLDNWDGTLRFIRLLNDPRGLNIGQRRVTVSTCGLTDRIHQLAKEGLQVTLAVSLHAPNDDVRAKLMPVAKKYPMDGLLAAARAYAGRTGRRVTYEYAMIRGVNDRAEHARELAGKLRGSLCHVNLIPLNEARGGFAPSNAKTTAAFAEALARAGVETTVRRSLGGDIGGACGQLKGQLGIRN